VGIRTRFSPNRSLSWPVIGKVFCRKKRSIKVGLAADLGSSQLDLGSDLDLRSDDLGGSAGAAGGSDLVPKSSWEQVLG